MTNTCNSVGAMKITAIKSKLRMLSLARNHAVNVLLSKRLSASNQRIPDVRAASTMRVVPAHVMIPRSLRTCVIYTACVPVYFDDIAVSIKSHHWAS